MKSRVAKADKRSELDSCHDTDLYPVCASTWVATFCATSGSLNRSRSRLMIPVCPIRVWARLASE